MKLPALSVVAGEMRLGSGWLRLDPWILGNPNGSSMESLHRITLALVGVGWVGVGVLLLSPAGVVLAVAVAGGGEAGTPVAPNGSGKPGAGGVAPWRITMRVNGIWMVC